MTLFVFLDESAEYTYHAKSTKYLVYTGVVTAIPTLFTLELATLRYQLHAQGESIECFHAAPDKQTVRDEVFKIITSSTDFTIHSMIVRKNRVNPSLYKYGIYSIAYRTLLKYLVGSGRVQKVRIIVDTPPDKDQEGVIKNTLRAEADEVMSTQGVQYSIDHHKSSSHALLQVADYCAWAIQKKWQSGDMRSYDLIKGRITNEYDIFANSDYDYY